MSLRSPPRILLFTFLLAGGLAVAAYRNTNFNSFVASYEPGGVGVFIPFIPTIPTIPPVPPVLPVLPAPILPPGECGTKLPWCSACSAANVLACDVCCMEGAGPGGTPGTCCKPCNPCNAVFCCDRICDDLLEKPVPPPKDGTEPKPDGPKYGDDYEKCKTQCICGSRGGSGKGAGECFAACMSDGAGALDNCATGDASCCRSYCLGRDEICPPKPNYCEDGGGGTTPPTPPPPPGGGLPPPGGGTPPPPGGGTTPPPPGGGSPPPGGGTSPPIVIDDPPPGMSSRGGGPIENFPPIVPGDPPGGASSSIQASAVSSSMSQQACPRGTSCTTVEGCVIEGGACEAVAPACSALGGACCCRLQSGQQSSAASSQSLSQGFSSAASSAGSSTASSRVSGSQGSSTNGDTGGTGGSSAGDTNGESSSSTSSYSSSAVGYCCISQSCVPSLSCSQTVLQCTQQCFGGGSSSSSGGSQSSGSSRSSAVSASSASSILVSGQCTTLDCVLFGNAFCAAQGKQCELVAPPECFTCEGGSSSSSSSRIATVACRNCELCGAGLFNSCDADECGALGSCMFDAQDRSCAPDPSVCSFFCCLNNICQPGPLCSQSQLQCQATCGVSSSSRLSSRSSSVSNVSSLAVSSASSQSSSQSRISSSASSAGSVGYNQLCGNGFIDAGEACDDGNRNNADACSNNCGRVDDDACTDDRNCASGLCMNGKCVNATTSLCGNLKLNSLEQCDDGNTRSNDGCSNLCILESGIEARCGDAIINLGETCDDGNLINTDSCSNRCLRGGNQECTENRECASNLCLNGLCAACIDDSQCALGEVCTNGKCLSNAIASISDICGDGVIGLQEECDDGNARDLDGCSVTCLLEGGVCGDGILQSLMEQCEPSLHNPYLPYQCTSDCRYSFSTCGNEAVDLGEECDMGRINSDTLPDRCRGDCSFSRCGDGVLDSAEMCDDGNRTMGDGCDVHCRRESPAPTGSMMDLPFIGTGSYLPTQPIDQTHPPVGDTGPAALAVMAAGAAAGYAWMKRRRRRNDK